MTDGVRILVWHDADDQAQALEDTYHRISRQLAGTPGLLGNELWRSTSDPRRYAVVSEWLDLAAFEAWADDAEQHRATRPLRRYRSSADPPFDIYQVAGAPTSGHGAPAHNVR